MKSGAIIAILVIFIGMPALSAEADSSEIFFYVQLRASVIKSNQSFGELHSAIKEVECSDGYFRYLYGKFETRDEAYRALTTIKERGFKDAFITSSQKLSAGLLSNKKTTVIPSGENVKTQERYTVQLSAMKFPVYLEEFEGIKDVTEYYCPDMYYRYCSGNFDSLEKASEYLSRIKDSGYQDAFIIPLNKYTNFRIE